MPIPVITATSTAPMVKQQLVTEITTALATASTSGGQFQVTYAYTGAATKSETVFLGEFQGDEYVGDTDAQQRLVGLNPGRRRRDEEYDLPVTVWTFRPDLSTTGAATAEAHA